jgi:hypothetical protein
VGGKQTIVVSSSCGGEEGGGLQVGGGWSWRVTRGCLGKKDMPGKPMPAMQELLQAFIQVGGGRRGGEERGTGRGCGCRSVVAGLQGRKPPFKIKTMDGGRECGVWNGWGRVRKAHARAAKGDGFAAGTRRQQGVHLDRGIDVGALFSTPPQPPMMFSSQGHTRSVPLHKLPPTTPSPQLLAP